jgi:hypothetical protein
MDPNFWRLAEVIHNERLQEAAKARYFRETGLPGSGWQKRVLRNLGSFLVASGQKLGQRAQSDPVRPIPREA